MVMGRPTYLNRGQRMTRTSYAVEGLTCGYCIGEVMEHVRALVGVTGVAVDLVRDGSSPVVVTSAAEVEIEQVRRAGRRRSRPSRRTS